MNGMTEKVFHGPHGVTGRVSLDADGNWDTATIDPGQIDELGAVGLCDLCEKPAVNLKFSPRGRGETLTDVRGIDRKVVGTIVAARCEAHPYQ